jgi:hypothetical protein
VSTEPLSYQLLEALQAQLQTISVANGYRSELGSDIRLEAYTLEELGGEIGLRAYVYGTELTREATGNSKHVKKDREAVLIDAIVPIAASTAQRDAHRAREDISDALDRPVREWLAGELGEIEIETQRIELRPGGLRLIVVQTVLSSVLTKTLPRT